YHFPRRYAERGELTDIASLRVGEDVTIMAQVLRCNPHQMKSRPGWIVDVLVGDGSGKTLSLAFFTQKMGQAQWRASQLRPGTRAMFAGTVSEFQGKRQLTHPDYLLLDEDDAAEDFASALIPVYPATKDLYSWQVAKLVSTVMSTLEPQVDPMPATLRSQRSLMDLSSALREIHRPASWATVTLARNRLKWDEAFAVQISLVQRKMRAAQWPAVPRRRRDDGLLAAFDAELPFPLTNGQRAVGEEIAHDLAVEHPMHRLLQGEVGSGKTVCALRGMLQVVDCGAQAAILAPTEVLAAQHYRSMRDLLGAMGRAGELDGAEH